MGIYAIAFTAKGMELAGRLSSVTGGEIEIHRCAEGELFEWTDEHFQTGNALIFIGAAGIAVRAIAHLLKSKTIDPSVIVIDEQGRFVIPILSGHIGKANALASALADYLGGVAAITTATDTENVFAVDNWASSIGLKIANPERIKAVSSKLLNSGSVTFSSIFPIGGNIPHGLMQVSDEADCDFTISYLSAVPDGALHLIPPVLTLGVGCKKDTSCQSIERAFSGFMDACGCHPLAVSQVCSIDLKAQEPGLLEFCASHAFPVRFFTAQALGQAVGSFSASPFVEEITGVDNVCERSAVLGSKGNLLVRKTVFDGITMALAISEPPAEEHEQND